MQTVFCAMSDSEHSYQVCYTASHTAHYTMRNRTYIFLPGTAGRNVDPPLPTSER